jgi:hypothetical protein
VLARSIRSQLHSQTPREAHSEFSRANPLTLTAVQNRPRTCHFLSLPPLLSCPNPHSLSCGTDLLRRCFPTYLLTRFPALAVFGRRPAERVLRSVLPASENLHNNLHNSRPEQVQQTQHLFDDLVGELLEMQGHVEAE